MKSNNPNIAHIYIDGEDVIDSFEDVDNVPTYVLAIAKLKSKVIFIKDVNENESISYSRRFKTTKKMRIATVPMGYADGLRRALSNKGIVVINGKKANIVGSVCMDSVMVDVTDIENVGVGTDVYFWDNENYTLEEMSDICDTINYEILCTISDRVKRVFID